MCSSDLEQGECGFCSVYLDGVLVCSCLVLAGQADGRAVETVEGVDAERVRRAFVDAGAVQRIEDALRPYRYERVIDLTRPARTCTGDTVILEFAPAPGRRDRTDPALAPVPLGDVVSRATEVAAAAGVTTRILRLGRLVSSEHGPVVLDSELVLGFSRTVTLDDAISRVCAAGGRVVEDLSEPAERSGPVLVARFDHARPETALGLAEAWLDTGLLHWFEPNLVEH